MPAIVREPPGPYEALNLGNRTVGRPLSARLSPWVFAAVAVPILALLAMATLQKGVWYDELWSKWMADRALGLGDAARERWFQDVHPPLFYALNWAVSALIGPDIVAHRWLNFAALAALGGVAAYVARVRPETWPAIGVGFLLLLSNRDIVLFSEYRSYALILCATAALMLLLGEMVARARDLSLPQDGMLLLLLGTVIALSLNLHYISTLICGIAIGVFSLDRARLSQWRWAGVTMGIALVAMVPVVASLWAQRPYLATAVPNFWVKTDLFAAVRMLGGKFVLASGFNLVVIGFLVMALRRATTSRGTRHFALLALVSAATACLLLFAINVFKPIVVPRYLVALSPIIISAIAVLVGNRIAASRWLQAAFLANAAAVALFYIWPVREKPAWDEGARMVAAAARACPGTRVYSIWRMDGLPVSRISAPPNEQPFMAWAIADLGATYGIQPTFVDPASPPTALTPSAAGCPTILWVEHAAALDGPRTAAAAGLTGSNLKTIHTRTGTIIMQVARQ